LATARLLRDRGWKVMPTARKPADLDQLRADGFEPLELDLADAESCVNRAAAEALERLGGQLGGLVNNAGFGQAGAVEDLTRELLRYQFEANLIGMQDFANRLHARPASGNRAGAASSTSARCWAASPSRSTAPTARPSTQWSRSATPCASS
jgi:NAD(P)-dependent dehydrogenase (short-subunit alcohol dehydrogenase family)